MKPVPVEAFRSRPRLSIVSISGFVAIGNAGAQQAADPPASPFAPDTPGASHAASDLRISGPNPDGWFFPITRLNEYLPNWLQFGGQFRDRVESPDGIGYGPVQDTYDLTQLRFGIYTQPAK